jgi:hypothetical protein
VTTNDLPRRERLEDADGGCWLVSTEVSQYVVDLDGRRLMRLPGAVAGPHWAGHRFIEVRDLPNDWQACELIAVIRCILGERFLATDRDDYGALRTRHGTVVTTIEPLDPATHPPFDSPRG